MDPTAEAAEAEVETGFARRGRCLPKAGLTTALSVCVSLTAGGCGAAVSTRHQLLPVDGPSSFAARLQISAQIAAIGADARAAAVIAGQPDLKVGLLRAVRVRSAKREAFGAQRVWLDVSLSYDPGDEREAARAFDAILRSLRAEMESARRAGELPLAPPVQSPGRQKRESE